MPEAPEPFNPSKCPMCQNPKIACKCNLGGGSNDPENSKQDSAKKKGASLSFAEQSAAATTAYKALETKGFKGECYQALTSLEKIQTEFNNYIASLELSPEDAKKCKATIETLPDGSRALVLNFPNETMAKEFQQKMASKGYVSTTPLPRPEPTAGNNKEENEKAQQKRRTPSPFGNPGKIPRLEK